MRDFTGVSRILPEARKREIVDSIVGNNGTPKLPFPTSSSLRAELAASSLLRSAPWDFLRPPLRYSILCIDINVASFSVD